MGLSQGICFVFYRRDGQIRVAGRCNLAIAPLLLTYPVDHLGPISTLLGPPLVDVALAFGYTSGIWIDDSIAMVTPIRRIRSLEFLKLRELLLGNSHTEWVLGEDGIACPALLAVW